MRPASIHRSPRPTQGRALALAVLAAAVLLAAALPAARCRAALVKPAHAARTPPWRAAAIAALSARGDAASLATAALLASGGDALDLANRAAELAPDDTAIGWIVLRVCAQTPGCDLRGDATALRWLDPDNGAAWLPAVASGMQDRDQLETDRALAHMARGTDVDFYWNRIVVTMVGALKAVADRVPSSAIGSDAARLALAEHVAAAQIIPRFTPLFEACRDAKPGTPRRTSCETIAKLLERGDTVSAQYAGIAIAKRYAPADGRESRALGERRRVLEWRVASAAAYDRPLLPWLRSAHARWRLERMRTMKRQEEVILAVLRERGVPLDPPPPPPPQTPPPAPPEPLHLRLP